MSQQLILGLSNRNAVRNAVCIGTYVAIIAIASSLLLSPDRSNMHVLGRLLLCGIAFLYITTVEVAALRKHMQLAAYVLISFYISFATLAVLGWGVTLPVVMLAFGLAIVLAGILLGPLAALHTAAISGLIVTGTWIAIALRWYVPGDQFMAIRSSASDIFASCMVFGLLALMAWFYQREVAFSSANAERAQSTMVQQKAILINQVRKRKSKLEQIQLEEIRRMYRFAELGQLGVTLLHDLANYLTALTLELDNIQSKRHAKAIDRARHIIHYLESSVDSTRDRLHGDTQNQSFNVIAKTGEAVTFLRYKAEREGVVIDWQPPARSWTYVGDPTSFCQIATIVTSNAIDAYGTSRSEAFFEHKRLVVVAMERDTSHIVIRVGDWGKGIPQREQKYLFKPFHSTKKMGLGIGLFMARQTIEANFSGTLVLNTHSDHTEFVITLPLQRAPTANTNV